TPICHGSPRPPSLRWPSTTSGPNNVVYVGTHVRERAVAAANHPVWLRHGSRNECLLGIPCLDRVAGESERGSGVGRRRHPPRRGVCSRAHDVEIADRPHSADRRALRARLLWREGAMLAGTSANRATCPLKWRKRLGCVLGVRWGTRRLVPGFAYGPRESALAFAQPAADEASHGLALLGGQLQPGDPLGLLDHLGRDGGGLLGLGRDGALEDGRPDAGGGEGLEQSAARQVGGGGAAHGGVPARAARLRGGRTPPRGMYWASKRTQERSSGN